LALLIEHHRKFGYRHFVINHFWRSPAELADLRNRLDAGQEFRCFLLTLPAEDNLRRIERRAGARAIDEREFERATFAEEYAMLGAGARSGLGEPFDVSAPPAELVEALLQRLGVPPTDEPSRPNAGAE